MIFFGQAGAARPTEQAGRDGRAIRKDTADGRVDRRSEKVLRTAGLTDCIQSMMNYFMHTVQGAKLAFSLIPHLKIDIRGAKIKFNSD
ncbi:MAG TPA: hypothetical protein DCS59_04180 [Eubacterium sp.]|nr:hypothetical protein [Eubacterium sp.]